MLGLGGAAGFFACARSLRSAALTGGIFGVGYFGASLSWMAQPFLVFPLRDGWLSPIAVSASAIGGAVFWGSAFAAAYWLGRSQRSKFIALTICIALSGLAREFVLTGFPWALPAYVWSETPVAQSLAWIGPHGLTLLTVATASAWLLFKRSWIGVAAASVAVCVLWVAGQAGLTDHGTASNDAPLIRVVQPNVPQHLKWNRFHVREFYLRLLDLTERDKGVRPDLVVWPETAVTFFIQNGSPELAEISAAAHGRPVVFGVKRLEGGKLFNSLAVVAAEGLVKQIYDKHRLVPFGEYVPFGDQLAALGLGGLATDEFGSFSPGKRSRIVEIKNIGRFLALICYEAIFPNFVRAADRGNGILQITNDGWLGSFAGPQQHFAQARMRAIETALPLIRSANTGISAVIDGKGRIVDSIPLGMTGAIDVRLPETLPPTVYARIGDWPVLLLSLGLIGGMLFRRFNN